jgi:glycosyltransferase involved in cell wall biosynthesis
MKMRVLLDPQAFFMQRHGGVSRYVSEMYDAFLKEESIEVKCPILYSENLHLREKKLAPRFFSFFHNIRFKGKAALLNRTLHNCTLGQVSKELRRQQFDVFFATFFDTYFLKDIQQKPYVLTIYDMINQLFPQNFKDVTKIIERKSLLMQKATRIIAISQNTKNDILKFYPFIDANKIDVVYLYHSITRDYKVVKDLPENYILFVGNRKGYKNFEFFIEASASLLKNDETLFIVCAGGENFTNKEKEFLIAKGIFEKVIQHNFFDDELASYYKNARLFVFPSLYEGFGIPVLEAMYCGCPVVLPYHSSFPEVAGDAGVYFELDNKEDLANKILLILNDDLLRNEYIEKGKMQESKFSWENTAKGCIKTMKAALNQQ